MPNSKKLSLAFLVPRVFWERKMSLARRHQAEAIEAECVRRGHSFTLTGPGWQSWEGAGRFLDVVAPDVVDWYKPLGTRDSEPFATPAIAARCLTVTRFNECWWPNGLANQEAHASGTKLVICHHANDVQRFTVGDVLRDVVHIPHAAKLDLFGIDPPPIAERRVDVLLTGVAAGEHYPLRAKFERLLKADKLPGRVRRRQHPGYRICPNEFDKQAEGYASDLRDAKIVLVCASRWKYALAKYFEGWMAGAVLAGDVPDQTPWEFRERMVVIDAAADDRQIVEALAVALRDPEGLQAKATSGHQLAASNYTMSSYATTYLDTIETHA